MLHSFLFRTFIAVGMQMFGPTCNAVPDRGSLPMSIQFLHRRQLFSPKGPGKSPSILLKHQRIGSSAQQQLLEFSEMFPTCSLNLVWTPGTHIHLENRNWHQATVYLSRRFDLLLCIQDTVLQSRVNSPSLAGLTVVQAQMEQRLRRMQAASQHPVQCADEMLQKTLWERYPVDPGTFHPLTKCRSQVVALQQHGGIRKGSDVALSSSTRHCYCVASWNVKHFEPDNLATTDVGYNLKDDAWAGIAAQSHQIGSLSCSLA